MSSDTILIAPDGKKYSYDNIALHHHWRGQNTGIKDCFEHVREKARTLFDQGRYDEAKTLREFANSMRETLSHSVQVRLHALAKTNPEFVDEER